MPERINWSTNVRVFGGPEFGFSGVVEAQVYEKFQLDVASGGAGVEVSLIPDAGIATKFLLIKAGQYFDPDNPDTKKITYKVGDATRDLVGPIVLTDASILGALGADLTKVTFNNSMDAPVRVELLVGRDAGA